MYSKIELKKKSLDELKKILEKQKIKYNKSSKADELIELILKNEKTSSIADKPVEKELKLKKISEKQKDIKPINNKLFEKEIIEKKINFDDIPDLPKVYGKNKIVFMVKDPINGFVYWDLTEEVINKHRLDNKNLNKYLRIYDITETEIPENSSYTFDVRINYTVNCWYINFPRANRKYIVDLGYYKDNRFVTVLRSNSATLPRIEVSDSEDYDWKLTSKQYELVMKASGADIMFQHDGSQELMKFLSGNLEEKLSSY